MSGIAAAGPVSIDGVLGSEWAGAGSVSVAYNASAALGNFGAPSNENHNVAYTIYTRQDAGYVYVGLTSSGSTAGLDFANLYFGPSTGSRWGFEVTNDRAFRPGIAGYYGLAALDGTANEVFFGAAFPGAGPSVIEFAVPFSFFTSDPLAMGATPLAPGDTFNLRLSQSYGYSVAGGGSYGADRLGAFVVPVPLPPAAWGGLAGLAGVAAITGQRRIRRRRV